MKLVAHLHIPKCGGTSLDTLLQREYTGFRYIRVWSKMPADRWQDEWGTPHEVVAAGCISGHFDWRFFSLLPAGVDVTVLTILRDPVDRLLSLYHYWREQPQRYRDEVRRLSFAEFANTGRASEYWTAVDNVMTRRLAGVSRERAVDAGDLEIAKRNLSSAPVIGMLSHFDRTLERWAEFLGWQSTRYRHMFAQSGRLRLEQLDAGLVAEIRERQCYDQALYEWALARDWER